MRELYVYSTVESKSGTFPGIRFRSLFPSPLCFNILSLWAVSVFWHRISSPCWCEGAPQVSWRIWWSWWKRETCSGPNREVFREWTQEPSTTGTRQVAFSLGKHKKIPCRRDCGIAQQGSEDRNHGEAPSIWGQNIQAEVQACPLRTAEHLDSA